MTEQLEIDAWSDGDLRIALGYHVETVKYEHHKRTHKHCKHDVHKLRAAITRGVAKIRDNPKYAVLKLACCKLGE